jgi:hypothetical protein
VVPLWVCDALGEEAEYDGEEEEGEAAADVGMEAATEEGRSDDVSDAEDAFAAEKNGFNKDKNTSRRKEPTIKFENRRLGGRAKIIRHSKNEV